MIKQLHAIVEPRIMKIRHLDKRIRVLHKKIVQEHQELLKDLNPIPQKDKKQDKK